MKTVNQELLLWARERAAAVAGEQDDLRKKYRTAVRGAPAFVQGCGLAQAVAFWRSKAPDAKAEKVDAKAYQLLLRHLSDAPGLRELEKAAAETDIYGYAFLTRRVQDALVFLKRMVDAYIPAKEGEAGEESA